MYTGPLPALPSAYGLVGQLVSPTGDRLWGVDGRRDPNTAADQGKT